MHMPALSRSLALAGLLTLTLAFSGAASAEPPSRAARLGYIAGTVSFAPAGQPDWVQAVVNRPLTTGDRLWSDADSRVELQVGGAAIRLGSSTSVTLLNLDDRIAQVQLSQGTLKVRVRSLAPGQTFEVDTPNLAFTLRRPGEYRIDVDPANDSTEVVVLSGEGEVYGDGASYAVNRQQGYRFYGTGLSDYETLEARADDELDRWARERDRRADNSTSARYVSSDVVGYEDLDANGTWRTDPSYGYVWTPSRVAAGWTPYRDGHWVWVDPWGWTWVDDAPWGFAVSHYGRWTNIRGSWGWVPGPVREQAVYAPALVAFVGGTNFQFSLSVGNTRPAAVGWFPLAPREVYRPSYPVSRQYFDHINRSNAVIAPTTITNVYNTTVVNNTTINNTTNVTKVVYVNQQVSGAVVAVPAQAFVESKSVAKAAVPLSREAALAAVAVPVASVAPVEQSLHGFTKDAAAKPPGRDRAVVARTAPPPPPVAFAAQQKQLAEKPGAPIDDAQRVQLKPAAPAIPAPKVSVVTAAQSPTPTALPPATPPAGRTPGARRADAAKADAAPGQVRRGDSAAIEPARPAAVPAGTAKAPATAADPVNAEPTKGAPPVGDARRPEAGPTNTAPGPTARPGAAENERRGGAAKMDAQKAEVVRSDAAKADAARNAEAQAGASRAETARSEQVRADAERAAAAQAEGARADAARADASRAAKAKADASQVEAARSDGAKADAARNAEARASASRAEAARADAAAARAAADNAQAARSNKADASRAAAERADTARGDAMKAEAARAEAARNAAVRADAARAEVAPPEANRPAPGRAPQARPPQPAPPAQVEPGKRPPPDRQDRADRQDRQDKKAEQERKKAEDEAGKP
jgi:hypothetical protein